MADNDKRKEAAAKWKKQKEEQEAKEIETQEKMKKAEDEITALTIWFSKNKYAPQHNTVLQKKVMGPGGKPKMASIPCKIVKCKNHHHL